MMPAAQSCRNLSIAEMALRGLSQRAIARELGLTQQRISQILNDDSDAKMLLEQGQKAQIILLPVAIQKHEELIHSDDEKTRIEAIKMVYKNTGITPSHTQSTVIANLTVNNNLYADPKVSNLLSGVLQAQLDDPDIIDVDTTEEGE